MNLERGDKIMNNKKYYAGQTSKGEYRIKVWEDNKGRCTGAEVTVYVFDSKVERDRFVRESWNDDRGAWALTKKEVQRYRGKNLKYVDEMELHVDRDGYHSLVKTGRTEVISIM